jgi:hypothetical protein
MKKTPNEDISKNKKHRYIELKKRRKSIYRKEKEPNLTSIFLVYLRSIYLRSANVHSIYLHLIYLHLIYHHGAFFVANYAYVPTYSADTGQHEKARGGILFNVGSYTHIICNCLWWLHDNAIENWLCNIRYMYISVHSVDTGKKCVELLKEPVLQA